MTLKKGYISLYVKCFFNISLLITCLFPLEARCSNISLFTQSFDPVSNTSIQITPTYKQKVFYESDIIGIHDANGASIRVIDLQGNTIYSGLSTTLQLETGHYFVESSFDRAQFVVLPNNYVGADFLGVDASEGTDSSYQQKMDQIKPTWVRTFSDGTYWPEVNPQPELWDWSRADKTIAANSGKKIIWQAFLRPDWVSDVDFALRFEEYLSQVVERYSDQISAIQIWNQPWWEGPRKSALLDARTTPSFPHSWSKFYVDLFLSGQRALQKLPNTIQLLGSMHDFDNDNDLIDFTANSGLKNQINGWLWVDYGMRNSGPDEATGHRLRDDLRLNELLDHTHGSDLVAGEIGLFGASALGDPHPSGTIYSSGISWDRGMYRSIKTVVMHRAAGVKLFIPHVFLIHSATLDLNYEIYGWAFRGRGPQPKTSGLLMSCYWLNEATFVTSRNPGGDVFLYTWKLPDGSSLLFAWAKEGTNISFNKVELATSTDIFGKAVVGNTLTEAPILFHSASLDPVTLLNAVRGNIQGTFNTPPEFDSDRDSENVVRNQLIEFSISATDHDKDSVTYTAQNLPEGSIFDTETGVFSWIPGFSAAGKDFTITFIATDELGMKEVKFVTIQVLNTLFDGIIAHWKLDEADGTTAYDTVGANHGALMNFDSLSESGWVTENGKASLDFDGINDVVRLSSDKLRLSQNFTISAWVKPFDASTFAPYISISSKYNVSGLRFAIGNNTLKLQGQTLTQWKGSEFAKGLVKNEAWYHIVTVYENSKISAYINGVYQGTANWGSDIKMDLAWPSHLGTEGSGGYFFNGLIRDVMIFDRPLPETQILQLFNVNNLPPRLEEVIPREITAGENLNITLVGSDPDPNTTLIYSIIDSPENAFFDSKTGSFNWTPTRDQAGIYDLTFTVSDGGLSDQATTTITVISDNHPPILKPIGEKSVNQGEIISFQLSGSDPDINSTLTYSAIGLPDNALFDPVTKIFTWVPLSNQVGTYNISFFVFDGELTDSEIVTITVDTSKNSAPVLSLIGNQIINETKTLVVKITGTDPDGTSTLFYSVSNLPIGASFNSSTSTFSWTPTIGQAGVYNVTFTVSDGTSSDSETVTITVTNLNQPPIINPIGPKSIRADQQLNFSVSAFDPDPNTTLVYLVGGLPPGANFNGSTKIFSWIPSKDKVGTYNVTFSVSDGELTGSETVAITVTANDDGNDGNSPPVLMPIGPKTVKVGAVLSFTISATDPNPNTTLIFVAAGRPSGAVFDGPTRRFTWAPSASQVGDYLVTFVVSDGSATDSETIAITVTDQGETLPPSLSPIGPKSVTKGQMLSFTVSGSDPKGLPLSYSAAPLQNGASFDGSIKKFSWDPTSAQPGEYNVKFTVSNGTLSDSEVVKITVLESNRPPILNSVGAKTISVGQPLSFTISASDPDPGTTLVYLASGLPSGASFLGVSRTFTWTPTASQIGQYNVVFVVSDGSLTDTKSVSITVVGNTNNIPEIQSIPDKTISETETLTFSVIASDLDNDPLTYSTTSLPAGAIFSSATKQFTWTPTVHQSGSYSITFRVSDGKSIASQSMKITVLNVSQPPILDPIGSRTIVSGSTISITISATDPDPDTSFIFVATGLPSGAIFSAPTRTFTWTPTPSQIGIYPITFTVSDWTNTDTESITITVVSSPNSPISATSGRPYWYYWKYKPTTVATSKHRDLL